MENTYLTIMVTAIVGLFGGGVMGEVIRWIRSRRKDAAEGQSAETDSFVKVKQMVEGLLADAALLAKENREKDAALATANQQVATLQMMGEVANGTINKNNEFMKEVLIGWGEMKKSEEICQKKVAELERRDRERSAKLDDMMHRISQLEGQAA